MAASKLKLTGPARRVANTLVDWEGSKYGGLPVRSAGAYVAKSALTALERRGLAELRQVRRGKMPVYRLTTKGLAALER